MFSFTQFKMRGGGINLWGNPTFETSTTPSSDLRFARSESTPPYRRGNFGESLPIYQKQMLNKPDDPAKFPLL
jgi:hypothetical protein